MCLTCPEQGTPETILHLSGVEDNVRYLYWLLITEDIQTSRGRGSRVKLDWHVNIPGDLIYRRSWHRSHTCSRNYGPTDARTHPVLALTSLHSHPFYSQDSKHCRRTALWDYYTYKRPSLYTRTFTDTCIQFSEADTLISKLGQTHNCHL